jgi:hypothetical protein
VYRFAVNLIARFQAFYLYFPADRLQECEGGARSGLSQEPGVAALPDLPDLSDQQADFGALSASL